MADRATACCGADQCASRTVCSTRRLRRLGHALHDVGDLFLRNLVSDGNLAAFSLDRIATAVVRYRRKRRTRSYPVKHLLSI
jgi:hypothetical protein